jgi:mannose-1-phosphate guanylyltransferase
MIQQTVARLLALAAARRFLVITNEDLQTAIGKQLPRLKKAQIIAEPIGGILPGH